MHQYTLRKVHQLIKLVTNYNYHLDSVPDILLPCDRETIQQTVAEYNTILRQSMDMRLTINTAIYTLRAIVAQQNAVIHDSNTDTPWSINDLISRKAKLTRDMAILSSYNVDPARRRATLDDESNITRLVARGAITPANEYSDKTLSAKVMLASTYLQYYQQYEAATIELRAIDDKLEYINNVVKVVVPDDQVQLLQTLKLIN